MATQNVAMDLPFMKDTFRSLVLATVSVCVHGLQCFTNQQYIRGTRTTFAEMLQLTQTDNGKISGVLSHVELETGRNGSSNRRESMV